MSAPYGDPDGEDRLAASLVRVEDEPVSDGMRRHLQGRTRFFDRVVVGAIGRGARQVVILGAGYDGRALRYAAPGVRFFEVDHPATQADKRARLDDLGIDAGAVTFVAFDLVEPGLDDALLSAGLQPDAPAAMLCEGLLVYLTEPVLAQTFDALRALCAPRGRLAMSAVRPGRRDTPEHARWREHVAAVGEPAGNALDADDLAGVLADHRWRLVELPERAARAGLMMAGPVWAPTPAGAPVTHGVTGRYLETVMHRRGADALAAHLSAAHGLPQPRLRALDLGVFDVRCAGGRHVIVRLFPAVRGADAVAREAELLTSLRASHDYPAELPVAVGAHDGQPLLITEFVGGSGAPARTAQSRRRLGELLGRLQALSPAELPALPAGGAWHHLVPEGGPPRAELDAMAALLDAARARVGESDRADYEDLVELLGDADDCGGLPRALIHPDFAAANAIGAQPTIIDWAGCGIGPRLWSLAWLLWTARSGPGPVMEGYAARVTLTDEERERLPGAIIARPAVLAAWMFATGRQPLAEAVAGIADLRVRAQRLAARALGG